MHRVMIHPASYENCREAVDRAFELFPQNKISRGEFDKHSPSGANGINCGH